MGDFTLAASQLTPVQTRLNVILVHVAGGIADEHKVATEAQAEASGAGRSERRIRLETIVPKLEVAHFLVAKGPGGRNLGLSVDAGNVIPVPIAGRLAREI